VPKPKTPDHDDIREEAPLDPATPEITGQPPAAPDPEAEPEAEQWREGPWSRFKHWVGSTKGRVTLSVIVVLLASGGAIAGTDLRYPVVSAFYKNQTDITVTDADTNQPLPNATVTLAGQSATTDNHGVAHLENLKLGYSTLGVAKKAYKSYQRQVLVPVLKPNIAPVKLISAGITLSFNVTDKISGKPLDDAEITASDVKAISKDGAGKLVLLPEQGKTAAVTIEKDGYIKATLTVDNQATAKPHDVTLTPEGKTYFFSNRSGKTDLYEANLDGSDAAVVLAGTGSETSDIGLLPSVSNPSLMAIVSTREGKHNAQGNVISSLFLFDASSHKLTKLDDEVNFYNYRAWLDDTLVYEKPVPDCSVIKAYDATAKRSAVLVQKAAPACPVINGVYDGTLFYSLLNGPSADRGLYAIQANGSSNKRLSETPAQQAYRNTLNTLLTTYYDYSQAKPATWQSLNFKTLAVTKVDNAPANPVSIGYAESPNEQSVIFIDERDGKKDLYITLTDGKNERKLTNLGTVNQFVQWYSNKYVVFSVSSPTESALYAASVDGGTPVKIGDIYRANSRTYGGGFNPNY
jgi:hypothetical protein